MIVELINDGTHQLIKLPKGYELSGNSVAIDKVVGGLFVHTPKDNPNNLKPVVLATLAQNETELKQGDVTIYTSYDAMMADLV